MLQMAASLSPGPYSERLDIGEIDVLVVQSTLMLLERTRIPFPAPTWYTQLFVTPVPGNPALASALQGCLEGRQYTFICANANVHKVKTNNIIKYALLGLV